jgi:hypothetical protein
MEIHSDVPCRWIGWKCVFPVDVQAEDVGKVIGFQQVTTGVPVDQAENHAEKDTEVRYFEEAFENYSNAASLFMRQSERGSEDEESDTQLFGVDRTEESGQHRFAPSMPEENELHSSDFQPVDPWLPWDAIFSARITDTVLLSVGICKMRKGHFEADCGMVWSGCVTS